MGIKRKNPDSDLRALLRATQIDPTKANLTKLAFAAKREGQTVWLTSRACFLGPSGSLIAWLDPKKKMIHVYSGLGSMERMDGFSGFYDRLTQAGVAFDVELRPTYPTPFEKGWNEWLNQTQENPPHDDSDSRSRERQAKATGSIEDQAKVLIDRMRHGELDPKRVIYAAWLGDEVARRIIGMTNLPHLGADWSEKIIKTFDHRDMSNVGEYLLKMSRGPSAIMERVRHLSTMVITHSPSEAMINEAIVLYLHWQEINGQSEAARDRNIDELYQMLSKTLLK